MSSSRQVSLAPDTPTPTFRSNPVSPRTPSRTASRCPLNPVQFGARQPLRDDKIFVPFRIALREAKTLVTFVYKSRHCQGKLVPIPYPRNSDGEPVPPAKLIDHVESNGWDTNPNCFCSIRDQERVVALYVPRKISSPAYSQMSLVCPESECPYYVNIQEMYNNAETRQTLLSVEDDAIALPQSSGKKRKTRIPSWEARASGVIPVVNQFDLISKLFSRMGISRGEFDALFVICPKCNRVSRIPHSQCVIEVDDNSELDDDLEFILMK